MEINIVFDEENIQQMYFGKKTEILKSKNNPNIEYIRELFIYPLLRKVFKSFNQLLIKIWSYVWILIDI